MDFTVQRDSEFQLAQVTQYPTMDFHVRVTEQKVEALMWLNGKRYRLLGVRDEEHENPDRKADLVPQDQDKDRHF